ncbi:hypothetical protein [Thioclava sp. GXIMD4215]|uniref:hypothetical protein n=1 Tax=Thioclava sp. GXIMD4215 TaxID=3131928 RepID=UPI0038732D5F
MMMGDVRRDRIVAAGPRVMSVRSALEWAFGPENARMDFDHSGAHEFDRVGVSSEAGYVDGNGDFISAFQNDLTLMRTISEHDFALEHDVAFGGFNAAGWSL